MTLWLHGNEKSNRLAHPMQIRKNLTEGLNEPGLVIRNRSLSKEFLHQFPGAPEPIAWHLWKEMMLDLVIQSTEEEINQRMSLHITRSKHLLAEKIPAFFGIHHWHAHVIGYEYGSKVQSEEGLMDDGKQNGLPEAHQEEKEQEVQWKVEQHRKDLKSSKS